MKSPLSLIAFSSAYQGTTEEAVRRNHPELLNALEEVFDVTLITEEQFSTLPLTDNSLALVFIASGGTEGKIVKYYKQLPRPLALLTDGKANSRAASLEISSWIRQQGDTCRILHDEPEEVVQAVRELSLRSLMKNQRIGVFGDPSEWLVSSHVNYVEAQNRWGVSFVDVPLSRVEAYYNEETDADAQEEAERFMADATRIIEPNKAEIIKAVRLYHAIRRIAQEEQLDALTVQCFTLISSCHTTGCLALALLNDEGIVAGCEGDMPAIFTMLLCKRLTGADAFMANPSRIRAKEVLFSHCTIGLHQVQTYIVRSHFESGTGVAIQGLMREHQPVTVVKLGGADLSRIAFAQAILTENQNDPKKCRTQIVLRTTNANLSHYLLTNSIGNHHIILQGDHTAVFTHLCHALNLKNEVSPTYTLSFN